MVFFSLSEIKLLDILSSLMMDDTYKGRGKYHSKVSPSRWIPKAIQVFVHFVLCHPPPKHVECVRLRE